MAPVEPSIVCYHRSYSSSTCIDAKTSKESTVWHLIRRAAHHSWETMLHELGDLLRMVVRDVQDWRSENFNHCWKWTFELYQRSWTFLSFFFGGGSDQFPQELILEMLWCREVPEKLEEPDSRKCLKILPTARNHREESTFTEKNICVRSETG